MDAESQLPAEKDGWQRWWDHGTAQGGDVIDLWAKAKGLTVKEAIDDIIQVRALEAENEKLKAQLSKLREW